MGQNRKQIALLPQAALQHPNALFKLHKLPFSRQIKCPIHLKYPNNIGSHFSATCEYEFSNHAGSNYGGCHPWFFGGDNPQPLSLMMAQ